MAVQQILDVTADFNDGSSATLDVGGWDYSVVQLVNPSGTVNFTTSNDSGAITGISDGNAASALNFIAASGIVIASAAAASTLAAAGLIRFTGIGMFLRISGTAVTADKVIVRLYKIN